MITDNNRKSVSFSNHSDVLVMFETAQDVENDNREQARDEKHFTTKKDGQWEPSVIAKMSGHPRYTFDKCNPIIDQICGEMEQTDFDISVKMASGDASKEIANTYDGLIRNIENISGAAYIYDQASRGMVSCGLDGWEIKHDYVDADSFDEDLYIKKIANFMDRVWFDVDAEEQDMSDAEWCIVLHMFTNEKYRQFPKDNLSYQSISDSRTNSVYYNKKEGVVCGRLFYKKRTKRTLLQMSDGAVYDSEDPKYLKAAPEIQQTGVTIVAEREREKVIVCERWFDGKGWLDKETETVFSYIPIIPVFANFEIVEDKVIYRGVVRSLMDQQRVYNMAKSRQAEDVMTRPKDKIFLTRDQAKADVSTLQTMNTDLAPAQTYTHIDGQPPPYKIQGPQMDQGIQQVAIDAAQDIDKSASMFSANMGDNPGLQSGVAIEKLQNKGDNSNYKYFSARERAIRYTGKILVAAIPKVYTNRRQVRILGPDGSTEMVMLNDIKAVTDPTTRTVSPVEINNLAKGKYDVTCTVGVAFYNRQQKTIKDFMEYAAVDPSILQLGADVILNSMQTPGFDKIAERKRMQMLIQGLIPPDQQTDEEKQMLQQMQAQQAKQGQQAAPMDELIKMQVQTESQKAQTAAADTLSKIEERSSKIELQAAKIDQDAQKQQQNFELSMAKIQADLQKKSEDNQLEVRKMIIQQNQYFDQQAKTQAETLKIIREALGADAIMAPSGVQAFQKQAQIINEDLG